jgi:hypothetical protein
MRFRYNKQHLEFLSAQYKKFGVPDVTVKFNKKFGLEKTVGQIRSAITNNKIKCGRSTGDIKRGISILFPEEQIKYIKKMYQLHQPERVAELLNKKFNVNITGKQIKGFVHNKGINCERTGLFKKGEKPWNAGTKGLMKPNSGSFKKGDIPICYREIGSQRINVDGYKEVKVADPNKWELLHRHNWAKVHGKENMPENLRFKDCDKMNCEVANLEPLTNQEHMTLNNMSFNKMPEELRPIVLSIAKLDVKTSNLRKGVAA